MLIDTHSHLYDEAFEADVDDVLQRSRDAGVEKIFLPNINGRTVEPMLALARRHPGYLYPMLGLHPEDIADDWRDVLAHMETLLQAPDHPFIGVGEVGLDYYWDRSRYDEQQEVFAQQVQWALHYDLPLMIHTRSAHREMVDVLKSQLSTFRSTFGRFDASKNSQLSTLAGVFHCFGGTAEEAEELLGFDGFMLGIGGVVTFKKSTLPDVLREVVPLERIVVETDSPYLAPVPCRGKRNESAYVAHVVKRLAEIYDVSDAEVSKITGRNALLTFPKAR